MQQVTILVPHYRTYKLTQLCLRLLRKHTDPALARVIVIDNDSQDESTTYLKSLSWITLIERPAQAGELPHLAHSRALDLALAQTNTPYVLSIHTDTLVRDPRWLSFLIEKIESIENCAGVGSWKLEKKPWLERQLKSIEQYIQHFYFRLINHTQHAMEGKAHNFFYLRSHCALYRTDLLQKYQLHFSDGDGICGKSIHQKLVAAGHRMLFLKSPELLPYLDHVNHATMLLNPELNAHGRHQAKGQRRLKQLLSDFQADTLLAEDKWDH